MLGTPSIFKLSPGRNIAEPVPVSCAKLEPELIPHRANARSVCVANEFM